MNDVQGSITIDKYGVTTTVYSSDGRGIATVEYADRARLVEQALDLLREERNKCLYMVSLAEGVHYPDRYQALEDDIMGSDCYAEVEDYIVGSLPSVIKASMNQHFSWYEYLY